MIERTTRWEVNAGRDFTSPGGPFVLRHNMLHALSRTASGRLARHRQLSI
jgi:hypothetical protein